MNRLFCFGLGYSAQALAARLSRQGWSVAGTVTTPEAVERLSRFGYQALLFDGTTAHARLGPALAAATHLLVSVPPGEHGDRVLPHFADAITRAPQLGTIAYLSTIGVYGDWQGAWIDEDTPPRAASARSIRRLAADEAWLDLGERSGKRVTVLRLAGIYGPGRSAIDTLRAGKARRIIKSGQVFNRIHVEDVATAVAAVLDNRGAHRIYNVADDEPAPPQDVIEFAAQLLRLPPPPAVALEDADLSPMAASFYAENKRVRNTRMKQDLGVRLAFPTYREGLTNLATPSPDR